jgi:zinc D-Ala-D-Ala dipeptidase
MYALIAVMLLQTASVARTLKEMPDFVDASKIVTELQVELRYSTPDNFMKEDLYGDLETCYLHRDSATMLADAQDALMEKHPNLRLRVYDCARPATVQWKMWALVKNTPSQKYVANPARGSIHSFGCAVDLTVAKKDGTPLDMGTPYDFFGRKAHPSAEAEFLASGELTPEQVANREILRVAMRAGEFRGISHEWWHYDCAGQDETRKRYKLVP